MGLSDSIQKRYLAVLLLAVLGAVLPTACAPVQDDSQESTDGLVYRLPWLDSNGTYTLQDISLSTFRDPDRLRGDVGEIIVDPRVSGGTVVGEEPIGRWIRSGSRRVPADFVTLQAATIYAHLEKLVAIDQATGVASAIKTPARIGLLARISKSPASPIILNNAIFDGRLDSLFVVPFEGKKLFISLNAGILGHEHFHRIFQTIILNPIREAALTGSIPDGWDDSISCMGASQTITSTESAGTGSLGEGDVVPLKVLNQVLVRGVNEGFADFWGWAYARDDDFVERSLGPAEAAIRRLDVAAVKIPSKPDLRRKLLTRDKSGMPVLKSEDALIGAAYQFGTQYARILRGVVEALVAQSKMSREEAILQVRQALADSLTQISADVLAKWGREELDAELMLKPMFAKLLMMSSTGPAVLDASGSTIVCRELDRLGASANLKNGLCGIVVVTREEPAAVTRALLPRASRP